MKTTIRSKLLLLIERTTFYIGGKEGGVEPGLRLYEIIRIFGVPVKVAASRRCGSTRSATKQSRFLLHQLASPRISQEVIRKGRELDAKTRKILAEGGYFLTSKAGVK